MSAPAKNLEELLQDVELQHQNYLQSLRALHGQLAVNHQASDQQSSNQQQSTITQQNPRRRDRADSRITVNDPSFTPPLRALSGPTFTSAADAGISSYIHQTLPLPVRRSTLDVADRITRWPSPRIIPGTPTQVFIMPDDDISFIPLLDSTSSPQQQHHQPQLLQQPSPKPSPEPDHVPRSMKPLVPMLWTDATLLHHLQTAEFGEALTKTLEEVEKRKSDIDLAMSFREFAAYEREGYVSATCEIYDIGSDAKAKESSVNMSVSYDMPDNSDESAIWVTSGIVDAPTVWDGIKSVNPDGKDVVGRITIVQEPTPLMLAALHLTMSPHFDMTELLEHLLSDVPNRNRTRACMTRAFERPLSSILRPEPSTILPPLTTTSNVRQRSFFFVFKYYTVVGDGLSPAPWQKYDKRPSDKRLGDHVDIAECGSVLALSLGGEPMKPVRMRPRRESPRDGYLFDTFGPWQLLVLQSYPDDLHTVRTDDFTAKSFYNGPYAFMDLLITEYRDATRRNQTLHEHITKLITPPTEFMFDRYLRDKLLFEDKHFTYIRRYFWAYNTLAVINTGIKSMLAAYADTFTDDFWSGTHQLLWPHPNPHSEEGIAYANKMAVLRKELEKVVAELGEVLKRNERTRKEIENLRDQLFSGSSIKESRRAIDQGDNIRILTMISMIFLPLTFVTSIWGITEFKISASDWEFAMTMVLVCVPFIFIVILLQTRIFTRAVRNTWRFITFPARWIREGSTGSGAGTGNGSAGGGPIHEKMHHPRPPQGRKRRLMVVDGARAAAGTWSWWQRRKARRGNGMEAGELGRV